MTVDVLREPLASTAAWKGSDLAGRDEWRYRLSGEEVDELEDALRRVQSRGLGLLEVGREDFALDQLAARLEGWVDELENGRGFVLIKGLPIERYSEEEAGLIYWGIGQHLGIPVSQNASGDLLGHVLDTGRSIRDPSVRGYQTRVRLPYHTDGSDVVGLLCFRPARSGGQSSIVSSTAVYNEILRRRPDLVDLLYQPFYFDRREEQAPGEDPWYTTRLACWRDNKLSVRYIRAFIESTKRFPEVPRLTPEQTELLDTLDDICNDPEFHLAMDFEVGDMQFLNNYTILHSRTDYEDFEEPEKRRHLLRLWLTLRQGRELDADFGRMGGNQTTGGRGGVTPTVAA
ncbi:MAG: TauD/TfdA family dioxygenase [Acidimicrobiales bacterium]